jgi:hypothetical protein
MNFVVWTTVRGLQVAQAPITIRESESFTRKNETAWVFGSRFEQVLISLLVSMVCQVANSFATWATVLSFAFSPAPVSIVAPVATSVAPGRFRTVILPGGSRMQIAVERRGANRQIRTKNGVRLLGAPKRDLSLSDAGIWTRSANGVVRNGFWWEAV